MPHRRPLTHAIERKTIAHLFISLARGMRSALGDATGGHLDDGLLVTAAVIIGHAEGKPMSATKIELYTGVPRTTVLRKLDKLMEHGIVERSGLTYIVGEALRESTQVETYLRAFEEAAKMLYVPPLRPRPDRTLMGFTHSRAPNNHPAVTTRRGVKRR